MKNGCLSLIVSAVLSLILLGGCQRIVPMFFGLEERIVPELEIELLPQDPEILPRDFPGIEENGGGRREVVPPQPLQEE